MKRFVLWTGVVGLAGLCAAAWVYLFEPIGTHSRWERSVRADLVSLEQQRPPSVTPGQWYHVVSWTLNLHSNCASHYAWVEAEWRDGFAAELKHRLQSGITLVDIEWIWDEYAKHTKGGQMYSDKWRPTRDPAFNQME